MPEVDVPVRRDLLVSVGSEIRRTAGSGRLSGALLVAGDPGGEFHFRTGAVIEVSSPGAPGLETLLLHSGRVSEADWVAVARAGAAGDRTAAELVARGLVGPAELQLLCLMAALDGALAVGLGRIDGFTFAEDTAGRHPAAPQGIEPDWLLQEAERRIGVLLALGAAGSPFGSRPVRTEAGDALLSGPVTGDRREILLRVNGRRTPRDLAFLLGRSLYAVTVEVSRMRGEGLLATGLPQRRRSPDRAESILPLRPVGGRLPPAAEHMNQRQESNANQG